MTMVITRTPYRISFFGGGTDYPIHYREHGGCVLNTTINKYCHIICRELPPFFEHKYSIRYSRVEYPNLIDEIEHPSVRECLRKYNLEEGLEVNHSGDIPAMSGVGSSSSFTVGLVHALAAMKGEIRTKRELALEAIHIEQNMIGENVGSQDQVAAAFGGLNFVEFDETNEFRVKVVAAPKNTIETLQDNLMLFYTGISRFSSTIAEEQIANVKKNKNDLFTMYEMAQEALQVMYKGPEHLDDFGRLLNESWCLKRGLGKKVSTATIDDMYASALKAGALGGKLCGAGGGGFLMVYAPQEKQPAVREALKNLLHIPFGFETLGSHIGFYSHA